MMVSGNVLIYKNNSMDGKCTFIGMRGGGVDVGMWDMFGGGFNVHIHGAYNKKTHQGSFYNQTHHNLH